MERERYNNNDDAYDAMTGESLFGLEAVAAAAPVEPIARRPRRLIVEPRRRRTARRASGESGSWYLTPLAAFGAAAAMAFGMFAGGNVLLSYDDRISAFFNGRGEPSLAVRRAFAGGTVAEPRRPQTNLTRKPKSAEPLPVEHETEIEVISEADPLESPDVIYETPRSDQREEARGDRDKRFKDLEKLRDRQQKNLKEYLESADAQLDN